MMVIGNKELVDLLAQRLAIFEADMTTGTINYASEPLERMFGYMLSGDLEGRPVETLIPDELKQRHAERHRPDFAADPTPRMMGRNLNLQGRRQDGTLFPVEVLLLPKAVSRIKVVVGIVFDMTNRQRGPQP